MLSFSISWKTNAIQKIPPGSRPVRPRSDLLVSDQLTGALWTFGGSSALSRIGCFPGGRGFKPTPQIWSKQYREHRLASHDWYGASTFLLKKHSVLCFRQRWLTFWWTCSLNMTRTRIRADRHIKHSDSEYSIMDKNMKRCPVKTPLNKLLVVFRLLGGRSAPTGPTTTEHSTPSGNCRVHSGPTFNHFCRCFYKIMTNNHAQTSRPLP